MFQIGVLASGSGTNFQKIQDNIKNGYISNAEITVLISDRKKAFALKRAENENIPNFYIRKKDFQTNHNFYEKIIEIFNDFKVDLIILAGFLSILEKNIIKEFENRIINIHPSLIPSFCGKGYYGMKVHEEVYKSGVKITGATVHFVTEDVDNGPIIIQKSVEIGFDDTPESIQKKVLEKVEWQIFPEAVKLITENRIEVFNNRVRVKSI